MTGTPDHPASGAEVSGISFSFNTTVYFGASYSDNGNLYALTKEVLSTPIPGDDVGYQQAATNGDVFVEYTSDRLGVSTSLNFAVAGAYAVGARSLGELIADRSLTDTLIVPEDDPLLDFDISLDAQIARYLAETDGTDRSTTSATLMIGLNDLNQFKATETEFDLILSEFARLNESVLAATVDATQTLLDFGVGQVVVNTLPSIGFLAVAGDEDDPLVSFRNAARDEYNDRLRTEVAALADNTTDPLAFLGLTVTGVEEIVFVDTRTGLADIASGARLDQADLWGLI